MVRKLALAVSLALGSLPLSVHALGLGGIKTHSALNENLRADIELYSVKKGQLDTLKVQLAPSDVFARMGIERPFLLSRLKFKTKRLKNGKAIILVSSTVPIPEPFLDFFVEVTWPSGQLVKEFTILLDPPAFTNRKAPRVNTGRRSGRSKSASSSSAQEPILADGAYGPIAPNETLWEISERLKPAGVTVHQMMMAIYDANPKAFVRSNINLLKRGDMLQIPDSGTVQRIDQREAVAQFQQQTADWRQSVADTAVSASAAQNPATGSAAQSAPQASSGGHLKIAGTDQSADTEAAKGAVGAADNPGTDQLKQRVMVLEEQAESARQEASDLRAQLDELQSQLEANRRLLTLRDEELAKLQAAMTENAQSASDASTEPAEQAPVATTAVEEQTPQPTETVSSVSPEPPKPEPPTEVTPPPKEDVAAETPAVAEAPQVAAGSTNEWIAWAQQNWKLLAGAGGGGAALLLLLLLGRRKKDDHKAPLDQAPIVEEAESILTANSDTESASELISDTSFLSEYNSEEFKAFGDDTTEADPVTTADLYMADSRYRRAEEILQQAINEGKDSLPVRAKLLDVYYATQKKKEFFGLVRDMLVRGMDKDDPSTWEHIKMMGRNLDPGNPLVAPVEPSVADSEYSEPIDETDLSIDLSRLAEELDSSLDTDSESFEGLGDLDLNLDSGRTETPAPTSAPEPVSEPVVEEKAPESRLDEPLLDDLDMDFAETELHTELLDIDDATELDVIPSQLDETLADLSGDLEGVLADSQLKDNQINLEDERLSDLTDAINPITQEVDASSDLPAADDAQGADSEIGDEVETKLELARAFIEIGDAEGARSILHEVESDGTAAQQQAARDLLEQLKT